MESIIREQNRWIKELLKNNFTIIQISELLEIPYNKLVKRIKKLKK